MKNLSQVSITNLTCDELLDENGAITLNFFDSQLLLRSRFILRHCRLSSLRRGETFQLLVSINWINVMLSKCKDTKIGPDWPNLLNAYSFHTDYHGL